MIYLLAGLTTAIVALCGLVAHLAFALVVTERAAQAAERASWTVERRELLLRIQAPAEAVMQQVVAEALPSPPAVPFEDDDAFWESKMTKEQLAAAAAEAERAVA